MPGLPSIDDPREQLRGLRALDLGALKPFAALAGRIDAWGHDEDDTAEHRLTARDIRRAAALATEA